MPELTDAKNLEGRRVQLESTVYYRSILLQVNRSDKNSVFIKTQSTSTEEGVWVNVTYAELLEGLKLLLEIEDDNR